MKLSENHTNFYLKFTFLSLSEILNLSPLNTEKNRNYLSQFAVFLQWIFKTLFKFWQIIQIVAYEFSADLLISDFTFQINSDYSRPLIWRNC